jgi:iron complex outermembrane receptor protein
MKNLLWGLVMLFATTLIAQTTVSGTVTDKVSQQPIASVNIKVVGRSLGTSTDFDGKFTLEVSQNPPFNIELSIVGYSPTTIEITQNNQNVDVALEEIATSLDEVVVSASRTPERIMESPVTIERMDTRAIKNSSSPTFYDGLENLKGVDINTNSLTNKSVNTRGFATFSNTRFVQLVDGMDNSSPALNFTLGNLLGMNELDVNTIEILPGASSALYGANAFNGVLFMTSKNPFDHQGISAYGKTGITSSSNGGDNNFVDAGFRVAHAFSDKFAAKVSLSFLNGTEWHATDYNQYIDTGAGNPDTILPLQPGQTAFDQANIYGDEVTQNINDIAQLMEAGGAIPPGASGLVPSDIVSRTGYRELDLTDYDATSIKTDISLNYRPNGDDLEIIWNSKLGKGNTIYQGANRYNIKNFTMQQHKLEIRNDNFFVRAYLTAEDAGDSYDMRFTGINMNAETAPAWYPQYVGAYLGALGTGASNDAAHNAARVFADNVATPQPGTPEFETLFNKISSDPDVISGSKFQDETKLYHVEGNYNFHDIIDWAEIQVGGSWRQYSLNSNGTIFTDYDGPINYSEYGAYTQLQKKFMDDRLKFTGSIRYDKAQNFDGNVSPRISFAYSAGEDRNQNFRASFQTGFRNPTTQDQYIGLATAGGDLVGSAPDNLDRYFTKPLPVSQGGQLIGIPATVVLSGRQAYDNSFTATSLGNFVGQAMAGNIDPSLLEQSEFNYVQPEKVTAFEIGYRGILGNVTMDMSAYYNNYEDFIGNKNVAVSYYGEADFSDFPTSGLPLPPAAYAILNRDVQGFQVYTNSKADISSYGMGLGLTTKVFIDYNFGLSYTWSKFDFDQTTDPDYEAGFNTPEHQIKLAFGNPNVFKNFGFNINLRYRNEYLWQSTFVDAIIDARTVIDAQVSYSMPKIKSTIKIGAANLGGQEYLSAPGNGLIGSQYFASWTINP